MDSIELEQILQRGDSGERHLLLRVDEQLLQAFLDALLGHAKKVLLKTATARIHTKILGTRMHASATKSTKS
jgi:hypothetical protein